MKITKVTKTYFETEGERIYFFEPLDEEMTISELQELMNEHEKFILEMIKKMKTDEDYFILKNTIYNIITSWRRKWKMKSGN